MSDFFCKINRRAAQKEVIEQMGLQALSFVLFFASDYLPLQNMSAKGYS